MQLSFTYMYLLLLVLDPGGGAVGDPFLTIGLPIIAVAVPAVPTVLVSIMLLTLFYRRFVFLAVEHMSSEINHWNFTPTSLLHQWCLRRLGGITPY